LLDVIGLGGSDEDFYLISGSGSNCDHCSLQNLSLCLLWDDDTTSGFRQGFGSLDENAVEQWNKLLDCVGLQSKEILIK
jgi:hypothetical protein